MNATPELDAPATGALELAALLAQRAGLPQPLGVTPLPGGRNNRVYRVDAAADAGGPWLLKRYFSHPGDTRDRLGAEHAFLVFAAALGEARVPRPLARSDEHRAALYSFAPGRALAAGEVRAEHVRQALDLALRLNARREAAASLPLTLALPLASEACFSLPEHLELVAGRVARLAALAPAEELDREVLAFVSERLAPALSDARAHARALAVSEDLTPLPQDQRCVSPSDFGFHNALLGADGQLTFLDFEYAGWDDPAKLACDFFLQPRVPAPLDCLGWFTDGLAAGLGGGPDARSGAGGLARRVAALLPVYRVKWCCILLGEFLAVAAARRNFSTGRPQGDMRPDAREHQLAQARALLERDLQLP